MDGQYFINAFVCLLKSRNYRQTIKSLWVQNNFVKFSDVAAASSNHH